MKEDWPGMPKKEVFEALQIEVISFWTVDLLTTSCTEDGINGKEVCLTVNTFI